MMVSMTGIIFSLDLKRMKLVEVLLAFYYDTRKTHWVGDNST